VHPDVLGAYLRDFDDLGPEWDPYV